MFAGSGFEPNRSLSAWVAARVSGHPLVSSMHVPGLKPEQMERETVRVSLAPDLFGALELKADYLFAQTHTRG